MLLLGVNSSHLRAGGVLADVVSAAALRLLGWKPGHSMSLTYARPVQWFDHPKDL